MLTGGEPRGLPGMVIDRIELQRASEGRPLDDVIVHAHDATGTAAVLEIQVKREVAFSPSDEVFRDVVQQIAAAARRPDFWTTRYELAVATAKTSARIAGPVSRRPDLGTAIGVGDDLRGAYQSCGLRERQHADLRRHLSRALAGGWGSA